MEQHLQDALITVKGPISWEFIRRRQFVQQNSWVCLTCKEQWKKPRREQLCNTSEALKVQRQQHINTKGLQRLVSEVFWVPYGSGRGRTWLICKLFIVLRLLHLFHCLLEFAVIAAGQTTPSIRGARHLHFRLLGWAAGRFAGAPAAQHVTLVTLFAEAADPHKDEKDFANYQEYRLHLM